MKHIISTALCCVLLAGCNASNDDHHNQLESANERIADQNKLIADRDAQIQNLKQEVDAKKQDRTEAETRLMEKHKAEITALKEFHAKQIADLDTKNADLQMQLGLSEKQRLALQGIIDQPDRLAAIRAENSSIERVIWFTICLASLGVACFVGMRYFTLRTKRREDLVRVVAKLGHQL